MKTFNIPPLAGLISHQEAAHPGLGVDDNVARLRRLNYLHVRLYQLSAAFLNPTPEWEVKSALSLHLYLDSEHSMAIRGRVAELRRPPLHLDGSPDEKLTALMDELLRAQNTTELLAGVYGVLRPALVAAIEKHLGDINALFDFPTARVLRQSLGEQKQMCQWGAAALAAVETDAQNRAISHAWQAHLRAYLGAAGGVDGLQEIPESTLPAPRATDEFVADVNPRRDARSGEIYNFCYRCNDVYSDKNAGADERNLALMFKRFHEMDVPEMMASIVAQTPGKPWEYYRDMGRQLWDEARHALMGEVWFVKQGIDPSRYPNHVGWCLHLNLDRTPLERHAVLWSIEQGLMHAETGKRWEWLIAQQAGDDLATFFQDYDWADEVLHAQIGRRWLVPDLRDRAKALAEIARVAELPMPTLERLQATTPQEDWWPQFVREALGKESTSTAGTDNALTPRSTALVSG